MCTSTCTILAIRFVLFRAVESWMSLGSDMESKSTVGQTMSMHAVCMLNSVRVCTCVCLMRERLAETRRQECGGG